MRTQLRKLKNEVLYSLGLYQYMDFYEVFGMTSRVINDNSDAGHIVMADGDGHDFFDVLSECKEHFNTYFILESSDKSYHVINPVVRSFEETHTILKKLDFEDDAHRDTGYKRGKWVLRTSKKHDKSEPELVYATKIGMIDNKLERNNHVFSKPHLDYLSQIHGIYTDYNIDTVGQNLEFEKYWTFK